MINQIITNISPYYQDIYAAVVTIKIQLSSKQHTKFS